MRVGRGSDAERAKHVFLLIAAAQLTDRCGGLKASENKSYRISPAGGMIAPAMALLAGLFCKSEGRKKNNFYPDDNRFLFLPVADDCVFLVPSVTSELQSLHDEACLPNAV